MYKILELSSELIEIGLENDTLFVRGDNVEFSSSLIEGTYPDVAQVIPTEFDYKIALHTRELVQSITQLSKLAYVNTKMIRFKFFNNELELSTETAEVGSALGVLNYKYNDLEKVYMFNIDYLLQALKNILSTEVVFALQSNTCTLTRLIDEKDRDYIQIILGMRQ